jgi:hypothetical protein
MVQHSSYVPFALPHTAVSIGSSHNVAVGRGGDCFVWGDGDAGRAPFLLRLPVCFVSNDTARFSVDA